MTFRQTAPFAGSLLAVAILLLLHVVLGSVRIPLGESIRVLVGAGSEHQVWSRIIMEFRLPRAMTALVAGAGLAVAGLLMQTLFRNPLAGPFVLGINSGASLGVALVVLAGSYTGSRIVSGTGLLAGAGIAGDALIATAAVLGATAVLLAVLFVSRRVDSVLTLLVLGVLFSYAVSAVVSVLMHFSIPEEIQSYVNWTFGSFAGVTRSQLPLLGIPVIAGLVLSFLLVKPLNALLLGEAYAISMGVHLKLVRTLIIVVTAVLAGSITALCGPIAFVGVAVPHLARAILRDSDHRRLVPLTALLGSGVALLADLVAALPGIAVTLPLNAVTALLGAPVVILVVMSRGGLKGSFS